MKPLRFSVKTFLIGIAVLAAALGALESNSELVTSLVFSLNLALISFALVGAIVAAGQARVFWLGFAVFAGLYSLVALGFLFPSQPNQLYAYMWLGYSRAPERPQLVTTRVLDLYSSMRAPRSIGDRVSAPWSGGGMWPATIMAYKDGRYQVKWDDPSAPEWVSSSQLQPMGRDLERVGHSVFSLLFGFLGGLAAVCCFGPRDNAPAGGISRDAPREAPSAAAE
jgi:hypothetical protein